MGQTTAEVAVRKDFFVDLKVPAALTEGDKPRFTAEIHHPGKLGKLELRLVQYAGGHETVVPKVVEVKGGSVTEIVFDGFEVPDDEEVRLTLGAILGEAKDELTLSVPIRPWGTQAVASASGSSSSGTSAFVSLPAGRPYESPEMLVVLSPSVRRMLVELALGQEVYPLRGRVIACIPQPPDSLADRAGDLLAAASVLKYLRTLKPSEAPEAVRVADRVRGLVAELVTSQNDDGSFPWVAGSHGQARPGDRMTSARTMWALAEAETLGLMTDPGVLDKSGNWLMAELARIDASDWEARSAIVHALSARGKASFEQANALNRSRQGLPNVALAYLSLTFSNLQRQSLAEEVLGVLAPRGKTEIAAPGDAPRRYWEGTGQGPWHRSPAETTALAALAFARGNPKSNETAGAVAWLEAHRQGLGWQPPKAKGPALAALSLFHGSAEAAEDRYQLTVRVNGDEIRTIDVVGATEGQALRVPVRLIKTNAPNRVEFAVKGRGKFSYAITLIGFTRDFAPDQDSRGKPFAIRRRVYWADEPSLDGRTLPHGFNVAPNADRFENTVTQVPLGGKVPISIEAYRDVPSNLPVWERDFLVMKEYLPAGTTLVEGSVRSQASHYTVEDGELTLYFTPDQSPDVVYEVHGFLPGAYRALPPSLSSAYEPGRRHLGKPDKLQVLAPGERATDPYRPTPDELFARGKALFDDGRFTEAEASLKALWSAYTLRDDVMKEAARRLLTIAIKRDEAKDVVAFFEVLKEKAPEQVLSFDDIRAVGRAYGAIGEHERAFLVWRATAEAGYLEDARVGEALRQRGKPLESVAYLLGLWRENPSTAAIQSDFLGLAQVVAGLADRSTTDLSVRREMTASGVTRPDLLLQAIRLDQAFLAQSPKDPLADEASLAIVGAFLGLEDDKAVVTLARRYAELYPKSPFQDSFQYSEALGRFHLGEYDRAIAVAGRIAEAVYKGADGVDRESPNKWEAIYILGQIHDARREPAKALAFYERVADRFSDAAGAVKALTRKELKLPEVAVVKPPDAEKKNAEKDEPAAKLDYRNIAEADVKVYPVDLMRLYLTRRNLDAIAGIDLAGIRPLFETKVNLGDGKDFDDKMKSIPLPLKKDGAYLVMVRGDDRYTSGIVLVSPLEMQVLEEPESGRVRVAVRDSRTKAPVAKVQVKVIGTNNPTFFSGETDRRGVFVAEGVRGQVTAVAKEEAGAYAFHRGTTFVGQPPNVPQAPNQEAKPGAAPAEGLEKNVQMQNNDNQMRQLKRLEERLKPQDQGVKVKEAY